MAQTNTINKIKACLGITHSLKDAEVNDWIEAGLSDLNSHGVTLLDEMNPQIIAVLKIYCKAQMIEDADMSQKYLERYNQQREFLMLRRDVEDEV